MSNPTVFNVIKNRFLATKFYMDKCPILDIGIEELKKFSLEKVYHVAPST